MIQSTDLKNGITFLRNSQPYKVVKYEFIKMGRGGATVKLIAKNLITGATENISYSSNVSVDEANTSRRVLQYLYKDNTMAFFMDQKTFDQIEIPLTVLENQILYIKEGENVAVSFWEDKPLAVELTPKVTLKIAETDPGVKGNSASNMYKSAVLENGVTLKVPLFINSGERIVVDTRTGEYVERAKN
jgi:elongation factor P